MAGVPLPAPPTIPPLKDVRNPARELDKAIQDILAYLDLLRRQIERDYS